MTHLPEDVLAALALGDPDVAPADREHASSCATCSAQADSFARVRAALTSADLQADADPSPGFALWDRIAAATSAGEPQPGRGGAAPVADGAAAGPPGTSATGPAPARPEPDQPDRSVQTGGSPAVIPIRPAGQGGAGRARGRPWRLLAAALVCVLAGLGIGWFAFTPDQPTTRVLAATELAALDGSRILGSAQLLNEAGTTELRVSVAPVDSGSGFVEVWLINDDGRRMVSLGVLDADEAVFAVPPDAVAQGYRVVDLSREQYDDEPRHSGDSIMRGTLSA